MKIAIVQFPGSNCERETILAVRRAGMTPVEFLWNENPELLAEMDGYLIVGGFSYEDRSRAGIIAALDPVMQVISAQSTLGKPILGICNGAQILVESGLVPGLENNQLGMALTDNKRVVDGKIIGTGFYNTWITMRSNPMTKANAFTRHLQPNDLLSVPIAHAEGRFVMPPELLTDIEQLGLNVFQYCDEQGQISDNFPINPNGSLANTAAMINNSGNVMAMMPHPERTKAGDAIFSSMRDYILENKKSIPISISYKPQAAPVLSYKKEVRKQELLVQLVITDNHALTVQNTLRQLGIEVSVTRMVHWQIDCQNMEVLEKIKQTGILYNERKEYLVPPFDLAGTNAKAFLVRPREDIVGQQKLQLLEDHFSIKAVNSIRQGILWIFRSEGKNINDLIAPLMKTNIIFNPYAHECYDYE